jgi:hypothetical protein
MNLHRKKYFNSHPSLSLILFLTLVIRNRLLSLRIDEIGGIDELLDDEWRRNDGDAFKSLVSLSDRICS